MQRINHLNSTDICCHFLSLLKLWHHAYVMDKFKQQYFLQSDRYVGTVGRYGTYPTYRTGSGWFYLLCRSCSKIIIVDTFLKLLSPFFSQEPKPEAAAVLLRHPGIRPLRGHGPLLPHDGLPSPLRILNLHHLP